MNSLTALCLAVSTINGAPQGEVLNFTASWCGPCRSVAPTVERLRRAGHPIRKIDVDQHPELVRKYRVESVPQFILVINGKAERRLLGPQSESGLKRLIAAIPTSSESQPLQSSGNDKPFKIAGIPIPFLGTKRDIAPEDIQVLRGQSDPIDEFPATEKAPVANDPMEATVRLKVETNGMIKNGTGTVIDSRPDRTLIISCGHLFRDHTPQTQIMIEVFTPAGVEKHEARLVRYRDREDVSLLSITPRKILARAKLGTDPAKLKVRDLVYSVGCDRGDDPTRWQMFVKSLDNFVGASITECTQAPVEGRSGGGLFNRAGELIGICRSADREANSGLYSSLKEIHSLLDSLSLTALYAPENASQKSGSLASSEPFPTGIEGANSEVSIESGASHFPETGPAAESVPTLQQLSDDEVAAIAAALQFAGPRGVRVSIEHDPESREGYHVVIINHVETGSPSHEMVAETSRRAELPATGDRLAWENLLEDRRANKPPFVPEANEEPVWARERVATSQSLPERFQRQQR